MNTPHDTIGEYLAEPEPVRALWHQLAALVGDGEASAAPLEKLTLPAATVFLVALFEGEVVRGGFREFFRDHSGDHANETLQALREVGARVGVDLLEQALAIFPGGVAPTATDRRDALVDGTDLATFEGLDEWFVRYVAAQSPHRVEDIDALLLEYMKAHAAVRLTY